MRRAVLIVLAALALALGRPPAPGLARESLADDGRAGSVLDLQGTALVRPVGHDRFSPLSPRDVLLPGDQVKVPVRGAHAVEIRLQGGGALTLGPRGLIEIPDGRTVRVLRGDLEIVPSKRVHVLGPSGVTIPVEARTCLRVANGPLERLESDPPWLIGYRASTTDEWMGSLVANVDGRNVPLSVGYHKVDVIIRDQIAQTTVEQSFVNSTHGRLEGVFTFPLPADASISGFGMWIGDEYVAADIVEKQRAREIYEDILRRQKDPGLLEWSGGNLFKARVFPIPARGEKRIRIRYTQVLPLEGTCLRYRYALRSELLRARPVRELRIQVAVHSTTSIEDAVSRTHEVRRRVTDHDAVVEFDVEEYRPDRDFEVAVTLARPPALTVLPHRRGDDGYFMLLLAPPDAASVGWHRDLVAESDPLDVLIVADTSGSMDPDQREAQAAFVQALLGLLGPKDRFRLLTGDVTVRAWREEAVAITPENAEAALAWLDDRDSLGWSDLDHVVSETLTRAGPGTRVIHVGDGIGTARDNDPAALARRIRTSAADSEAVVHAVSCGAAHDVVVLEALASIGGGSVRAVGGEPTATAKRLLAEITQPVVRDLSVRFEGVRAARVYPSRLPNLPAGHQQALLGRFLPGGGDQDGRVIVTGRLDGETVKYEAPFTLVADEAGNSFLPRLWARRHLDALLAEGRSAENVAQIVAFSERFGIITPYTSFLVLENDADRERYGVKRRVAMRDAERFFADAKDRARRAIRVEQMQLARGWRTGLREQLLADLLDPVRTRLPNAYRGPRSEDEPVGGSRADGDGSSRFRSKAPWGDRSRDSEPAYERTRRSLRAEVRQGGPVPTRYVPPLDLRLNGRMNGPPPPSSGPRASYLPSGMGGAGGFLKAMKPRDMRLTGSVGRIFPRSPAGRPWLEVDTGSTTEPDWYPQALAILRALDIRDRLHALEGGLEIRRSWTQFLPASGAVIRTHREHGLLGGDDWWIRYEPTGQEPTEQWRRGDVRGAVAGARRLGRRGPATLDDHPAWTRFRSLLVPEYARHWAEWDARIEGRDGDRVTIRLTAPAPRKTTVVLVVDASRNLLLGASTRKDDAVVSTVEYAEPIRVGTLWLPRVVTTTDATGKVVNRETREFRALDMATLAKAFDARLAAHTDVIFLPHEDPSLADARRAIREGRAGFPEWFRVAIDPSTRDRSAFDRAADLAKGKPGIPWLRAALAAARPPYRQLDPLLDRLAREVAMRRGPEARFLATHLRDLAGSRLGPVETLALIETLRPVWEASGDPAAVLRWRQRIADLLRQAGREDEAVALRRRLAEERPDDPRAIQSYLNAYRADRDGALLPDLFRHEGSWSNWQVENNRERYSTILANLGRYDDLLAFLAGWIEREPRRETAYHRYLSTLLETGRADAANATIEAWFSEDPGPERTGPAWARISAAVHVVLGRTWPRHSGVTDPRRVRPLADLALRLSRRVDGGATVVGQIVTDGTFRRTRAGRELRAALLADLLATDAIETMPLARLQAGIGWQGWSRVEVDDAAWRRTVDRLRARWSETRESGERWPLARLVLQVLDARGAAEEAIAFQRERLATEPETTRPEVARDLMQRLAGRPFRPEIEDEQFALVARLQRPDLDDAARRDLAAQSYRWLVDRLLEGRVRFEVGPVDDLEKAPRAEHHERVVAARERAERGLVERLVKERREAPDWARHALEIEALELRVTLGEDVEADLRELLLGLPGDATDAATRAIRARCADALSRASIRTGAPDGLADRVLALFREERRRHPEHLDWPYEIARLLVILDRPEQLEEELRGLLDPDLPVGRWRLMLGYLLAETGRLDEAVAAFEDLARQRALPDDAHRALVAWHRVLGDDDRARAATARRFREMEEHQLRNLVNTEWSRLSNRGRDGAPPDLDPEILDVIRALLSRAPRPEQSIRSIETLYRTTKDPRLLASLGDAVVGRSPSTTYLALERANRLFREVHEEATCDEVTARLAERAAAATEDVDRRAMILLRALVERRAAEVLDQPGPHVERALADLRASFPESFRPGERRCRARFLAGLSRSAHAVLVDEQLRQLEAIHALEPRGTEDRLRIAHDAARTAWAHESRDQAIDTLAAAFGEHVETHGRLPEFARTMVDDHANWLMELRRFTVAETFLLEERERQPDRRRQDAYTSRLIHVYVRALEKNGTVSLGTGETLFDAARVLIERALLQLHARLIGDAHDQFCRLYRNAHARFPHRDVVTDLVSFSRTTWTEVLARVHGDRSGVIDRLAETLAALGGPKVGLTFLVEHLEAEPAWRRALDRGAWPHCGDEMGQWRRAGGELGDLEPRLLAVVLRELAWDLGAMRHRNRAMIARDHHFWPEKAEDFAGIARLAIAIHRDDPERVLFAARYLWHGLGLREEAIGVLLAAVARNDLHDEGRIQAVWWLLELERHPEAVPIAEDLVARNPDVVRYRCAVIAALHGAGRDADGRAAAAAARARLESSGRWIEGNIAELAVACGQAAYHDLGLVLFEEAIAMHRRDSRRGSGRRGDSTLLTYHEGKARCLSGLGRPDEAVGAAAAAIVVWSPDSHYRRRAWRALESVIREIENLDAFMSRWETRVAETGLDAAVIRRALGKILLDTRRPADAARHLARACALEPGDPEAWKLLVRAHDKSRAPDRACAALRALIRLEPSDGSLSRDLAERLGKLDRPDEAERAWTNLVEISPDEAGMHQMLAQRLERVKRHDEACARWRNVVRIRSGEPQGWLSLATAQIRAERTAEAQVTLRELMKRDWAPRFGDVERRAADMLRQLDR